MFFKLGFPPIYTWIWLVALNFHLVYVVIFILLVEIHFELTLFFFSDVRYGLCPLKYCINREVQAE